MSSFEVEAASRKKRKWCTICCSRQKSRCVDRVASHISMRAWIAAQKPGSTVKIYFPLLDFYLSTSWRPLTIAIDDATGHARSGGKKYRTRSRKKVSGRRFKTRSVGLVEAETFFCLAQEIKQAIVQHNIWQKESLKHREHPLSKNFLTPVKTKNVKTISK